MSGRLLTARDVADRLGVAPETVLRWTRNGDLPGFKLSSRAIRYDEAEIEAWWLARKVRGAAPREGESQPGGRAREGGYGDRLPWAARANPPHDAATTEENP